MESTTAKLKTFLRLIFKWMTRLQTMATLSIIFAVFMVALLTANAIFVTYRQVSLQLAEEQYRRAAIATAERLSDSMENYLRTLNTLASQAEMQSGEPPLQELTLHRGQELLADFTNRDAGVLVLDAQGTVHVTVPYRPDLIGQSFSQFNFFHNVRDSRTPAFSNIITEPGTYEDFIAIAVPITRPNGDFIGVLVGRFYIEFQALNQQIQALSLDSEAWAYAVDREGYLIYHPFHQAIGTDFNYQEVVKRLREGESTGAITTPEDSAQRTVEGFAVVPITGWGLVVGGPWNRVVEPAQRALEPAGLVLIIGVLLVSLVAVWAVSRITGSIWNLVVQSQQVAAGDYEAKVKLSTIGEIRELGIAFNDMVEQIRKYQASLQRYVADVTESQEEERKRIARDLHDDTVQSLIAVGQRIDLVKGTLNDPDAARERLNDLRKLVNSTIASVRQFSRDLRPLALEDLGLVAAMQYLVNQLAQQEQITVNFHAEGKAEGLTSNMEIALYRILQETLNNVKKHAQATEVNVLVQFTSWEVQLTVQDDGRGFEVPESVTDFVHRGSFGMMGLQERAQLLGGQFVIQSQPYEGTTVRLTIPRHSNSQIEHHYLPPLSNQ